MNKALPRPALYLFAVFCLGFGLILPAHPALAGEIIVYDGSNPAMLDTIGGVAGSLAPSGSSSNKSTSLSNNRITVESGTVPGNVYGARNTVDADAVTNNQVFIKGGTVNQSVYGGRSVDGNVTYNSVFIGGVAPYCDFDIR